MSEIKGQLLGIIIVLMIFGIVSGAMIAMFNNFTNAVSDNVAGLVSEQTSTSIDSFEE